MNHNKYIDIAEGFLLILLLITPIITIIIYGFLKGLLIGVIIEIFIVLLFTIIPEKSKNEESNNESEVNIKSSVEEIEKKDKKEVLILENNNPHELIIKKEQIEKVNKETLDSRDELEIEKKKKKSIDECLPRDIKNIFDIINKYKRKSLKNIVKRYIVEVGKLNMKISFKDHINYLEAMCFELDISVNEKELEKLFREIRESIYEKKKKNEKIKEIKKDLKEMEKLLHDDEVMPYLEKFILTVTQRFDNNELTPDEYVEKLNDLIHLLKYKKLISVDKEIEIMYLNFCIENMKYKFYIKELKEKLKISDNESEEQIIEKYLSYYGNSSKNKVNIKLLSKILSKDEVDILKKVEDYKNYITKKYQMEKLEKELLGNKQTKTIEEIDDLDGYQFEDFLVELFKGFGYYVEPTSYSGDYGADLIISDKVKRIAIQAKNYTGNVGNAAVQEIVAAQNHYKCDIAMVITNSYFTKQAKMLATTNGTILIGRDELTEILRKGKMYFIELCSK